MLQKEVEHGMKRATIVKQISLTFLLHFRGLDAFFCYQKGPSTFGMEILSNTKNSRPKNKNDRPSY